MRRPPGSAKGCDRCGISRCMCWCSLTSGAARREAPPWIQADFRARAPRLSHQATFDYFHVIIRAPPAWTAQQTMTQATLCSSSLATLLSPSDKSVQSCAKRRSQVTKGSLTSVKGRYTLGLRRCSQGLTQVLLHFALRTITNQMQFPFATPLLITIQESCPHNRTHWRVKSHALCTPSPGSCAHFVHAFRSVHHLNFIARVN